MKTTVTILILLLVPLFGISQSIEKFSIDSGGASKVVGDIEVLYTLGEVNVQELAVADIQVSEGFINPAPCAAAVTAVAQDPPTLYLDTFGKVTLTPSDVDNDSTAACSGAPFLAFETSRFFQL